MKIALFAVLAFSVLFAVIYAFAQTAPVKITSPEVHAMMKNEEGWYIFDMRTNLNYILAHMPQARSIPMFMLEKRMKEIPKNAKTVLIFQSDADAKKGWELLMKNGYDPKLLRLFSDTMDEWVEGGYPFEDTIPVGC
jgi:rhodanese-related sulfurtransferase